LKRANGERRAGDFAEFAHEVWVLPVERHTQFDQGWNRAAN